ncbi:uncharacterized protein LOC135205706 [Macrobrachium nipponense]|uniref:uncharacterized protein LOC135205706 n=1 Tax=Macrobrachium nipponense TaxID=159736 RepID=UPI0030C841F9
MASNGHVLEEECFRDKMKNFWKMYNPSVESMMLSHDAKNLGESEKNEILSYLPNYKGKRVLELGAGIGRFTPRLAQVASHVTTVDFIQEYVDYNKKENGHLNNIVFKCADVTKLDFPPGSFDLVFSNWLFMYLSDEETNNVFRKVLEWLAPEGCFFLRESCYHQSGNMKREENPTIYRTPIDYCHALEKTTAQDKSTFKIVRGKSILTYIKYHCNPNQLCFLAKKTSIQSPSELMQTIHNCYNLNSIIMAERAFGHMWFSTGGEATNRDLCSRLTLHPDQLVLDVGCGTGASAFFMARHYGVKVNGIDLSHHMIHLAIERQGKQEYNVKKRVHFEINNVLNADYDSDTYDVIYSRDAIHHVSEKRMLFKKLYKWLKPGGTLFFSDHCAWAATNTKEFVDYANVTKRWTLGTVASYCQDLRSVGFVDVQGEDKGNEFVAITRRELRSLVSGREAFVSDFSQEAYDELIVSWEKKIRFAEDGQLTWALFSATK